MLSSLCVNLSFVRPFRLYQGKRVSYKRARYHYAKEQESIVLVWEGRNSTQYVVQCNAMLARFQMHPCQQLIISSASVVMISTASPSLAPMISYATVLLVQGEVWHSQQLPG